jgi:hypothetical protein
MSFRNRDNISLFPDILKIAHTGFARHTELSYKTQLGILSGPDNFLTFILLNFFSTVNGSIIKSSLKCSAMLGINYTASGCKSFDTLCRKAFRPYIFSQCFNATTLTPPQCWPLQIQSRLKTGQ